MDHDPFSPRNERDQTSRGSLRRDALRSITALRLAFRQKTAQPDRTIISLTIVLVLLTVGVFPAGARADTDICGFPVDGHVRIQREGETQAVFAVSLAETTPRHRRGLMHCPLLPAGHGMLFIYNAARPRVFWMKDTYLELAIIFIADDGRIAAIEKGVPRSLTRIPSPGPVRLVLEINHTEAQGLRHGDRLRWTRDPTPP
jgi:hypothetical protein